VSYRGLGTDPYQPAAPGPFPVAALAAWSGVVLLGLGLFWWSSAPQANRGRRRRRRVSRNLPPPVYKAFVVDSSGQRALLDAGPKQRVTQTALATFEGDPGLRGVYVTDQRGNVVASREARHRLAANGRRGLKTWSVRTPSGRKYTNVVMFGTSSRRRTTKRRMITKNGTRLTRRAHILPSAVRVGEIRGITRHQMGRALGSPHAKKRGAEWHLNTPAGPASIHGGRSSCTWSVSAATGAVMPHVTKFLRRRLGRIPCAETETMRVEYGGAAARSVGSVPVTSGGNYVPVAANRRRRSKRRSRRKITRNSYRQSADERREPIDWHRRIEAARLELEVVPSMVPREWQHKWRPQGWASGRWHSGHDDRADQQQARVTRNVRLKAKTEFGINEAIGVVREVQPPPQRDFMPPGAFGKIAKMGPGLYSYGHGKRGTAIRVYKSEELGGVMTSTRIAASKSGESHWLIDNHRGYPVIIRIFDSKGKTVFRVEEYARKIEAHYEPVRARRIMGER